MLRGSWGRSCALVAGVSVLLYLNSLPGEFVFDDHEAIENNKDVRSVVRSEQPNKQTIKQQ